jgi:hypothetical protein
MYSIIDLRNPAIRRRRRVPGLLKEAERQLRYYREHLEEFNRDNWNVPAPLSPEILTSLQRTIDRALSFSIKWQQLPWNGRESRQEVSELLRWMNDSWNHQPKDSSENFLLKPLASATCILDESYPRPLIDQLELLFAMLRYPKRTTIDI